MADSILPVNTNPTLKGATYATAPQSAAVAPATITVPVGQTGKTDPTAPTFTKKAAGPSLDEVLSRFYGAKYTNASEEEKESYAVRYFNWLRDEKKQVISQLDQFKLYRDRCTNEEEYRRLSSIIDKMEAQYQLDAAKTVMTQGTGRQQQIGQMAVAEDYQNYDASVQVPVVQELVATKNEDAIKAGAYHASQVDEGNQTPVVKAFQTAQISEKAQKEVDKTIIDQYADFAKQNQVDIHQIMSQSKIQETVEYAASNICKMDKENQVAALKVTINTNNEKAIVAAASKYTQYDESVKEEVKSVINTTACESAKSVVAQVQLETAQAPQVSAPPQTPASSKEDESSKARIEAVKETIKTNDQAKITASVKNLSNNEMITLITECPNNPSVIKAILDTNPSLEVLAKIDEKYLKQIGYKSLISQVGFLSASAQLFIVRESAAAGNLDSVKRCLLLSSVKAKYDEYQKEVKEDKVIA